MRRKSVNFESVEKRKLDFSFSYEEIQKLAIEKWGNDLGQMTPSFFPKKGDSISIFKGKGKTHPHFSDCVSTLKNNGLFMTNVTGLVLLEILDSEFDFLKPETWVLGFDELHHLRFEHEFGHFVPCLVKEYGGGYSYNWFARNSKLEHDECVLAYRKDGDE